MLWLSALLVTVGYNTVRICFVGDSDAIAQLSDIENPKDGCDDESGEQKESKTKEKLDDFIEYQALDVSADLIFKLAKKVIIDAGNRGVQTISLDVVAPPPKA